MKNSQLLEHFFEKHRRQLKKESTPVIKPEDRPTPLLSNRVAPKRKPDWRVPASRTR